MTINRRKFISSTALAAGIPGILPVFNNVYGEPKISSAKTISLGLVASADNPEEDLIKVKDLGFSTCQLYIDKYSPELAKRLALALEKYQLTPITLICMGPGIYTYNFQDGPSTIGLVPREIARRVLTD